MVMATEPTRGDRDSGNIILDLCTIFNVEIRNFANV